MDGNRNLGSNSHARGMVHHPRTHPKRGTALGRDRSSAGLAHLSGRESRRSLKGWVRRAFDSGHPSPCWIRRYPRIWLIWRVEAHSLLRNCTTQAETSNLSVCIWTNSTTLPKFDAIAELQGATVIRKENGKKTERPARGRRTAIGVKLPTHVRVHVGESACRRKAIFAHPYPSKEAPAQLLVKRPGLFGSLRNGQGVRMEDGSSFGSA